MQQHYLVSALANSFYQVEKVFEGLTPEQMTEKITPLAMTPDEQMEHLCEVYHAFLLTADGGKYEWGNSYSTGLSSLPEKMEFLKSQHDIVVNKTEQNPELLGEKVCDFILSHNGYHVGQMCLVRLNLNSDWNAYSIYNH